MSITSFLQRVGEVMNMSDKGIGGLFQPLFQNTGIINVSYFKIKSTRNLQKCFRIS